ncbi:MAG: ABC transporter permease [Gemmatimonadaceae bacterium]
MSPVEIIRMAFTALRVNLMRSLLTTLGMVIGVASVIAMVALGNGAQLAVKARISRLGTTTLQINAQRLQQGGVGTTNVAKLTAKDLDAILERAHNVRAVNLQQDRNFQVQWRNKNANIQVTGTIPNFLEVRAFSLAVGRFITANDDYARRRVAVLGSAALTALGGTDPAAMLGEKIKIRGSEFEVVGVMAEKGATGFGDADEQVIIPFNTGRFMTFGTDRVNDLWALASSEDSLPQAMAEIESALRRSHRLEQNKPSDFTIRRQSDMLETLSETTQTLTIMLGSIASVSLLVGGIGIMNIMLVSVTERTREIGVRKALGATRWNILLQFLTEAVVLCLIGGLIGIGVGVGAANVLHSSFGWDTAVDPLSILVAFAFASATGMLFGVWPARRASQLDPIEALRTD